MDGNIENYLVQLTTAIIYYNTQQIRLIDN